MAGTCPSERVVQVVRSNPPNSPCYHSPSGGHQASPIRCDRGVHEQTGTHTGPILLPRMLILDLINNQSHIIMATTGISFHISVGTDA